MTMIETVREMQTRYIDGMKTVQEQVITYNERLADTVVNAMPSFDAPFADSLPKPSEVVDTYFEYLGEFYEMNKDFVSRMAQAWDAPAED